jgi:hypothetical protein
MNLLTDATPGALLSQVMTVSAPTGGSGARAADGIDSEALAISCRSVCKVRFSHAPPGRL